VDGAAVEAYADRFVVRQAVINLVDNAIKFSPSGGRIGIRVSGSADAATLDVVDSGKGISAAARDRIFDRFFRATHDGSETGTGLGLSIARGAVEANGGRLMLVSSGEQGSVFRVTLPRAPARPKSGITYARPA
jgi:signal transduction histidine kinase